ncbi:hypothetical protein UZ36_02140 [Candidatus Nitromaritima sp. SCGC AAA799-C22]|nr:hypothetical protein UZ36_02140 [Candidatus Nitromaritima sp. SCGC AAA799-C22]
MAESSAQDTPVLTVNARLARRLLFLNSERMRLEEKEVWETPEIVELQPWLRAQWADSWPDRFILSNIQSVKIWESIIAGDSKYAGSKTPQGIRKQWTLLNRRAAARHAAQAYRLIKEYKLTLSPETHSHARETELFLGWLKQYRKQLEEHGALDPADLIDAVRDGMKANRIPLPEKIELCGFDEITPQLETWLDFLATQRVPVTLKPDPRKAPTPALPASIPSENLQIRPCANGKEEAIRCARWIRSVFKPGQTIGVVVPEMDEYRQWLTKELTAELAPSSVYPWRGDELPFDISLGSPLADEPMIQTALHLFSVQNSSLPLPVFLYLLKNPYLKSGRVNAETRNKLEVDLLSENFTTVYLNRIEIPGNREAAPDLHALISKIRDFSENNEPLFPSAWAQSLSGLLQELGWRNDSERSLTSREIQCLRTWNECLDDLASLDPFLGKLSRRDTAGELQRIVTEKPFQVKTREQPIQVMGLLESAGMTFDHLWVMGCHADCLPAPPDPNPFLPVSLQKRKGLPHADPERELKFAEQSLRRLIESSHETVFSYPQWDKENRLKPSPLLSLLSINETEDASGESHRIKDFMQTGRLLESWKDPSRLSPRDFELEKFTKRGLGAGYRVLKDQADCPFRAFAFHRLRAESLEMAEIDFDNRERGILIHKALELFWKEHKTRKNLLNLQNENKLSDALTRCVNEAMRENGGRLVRQPRFSRLEEERSVRLLADWMDGELLRSDFIVSHEEKNDSIIIGKLKLKLRIDRIDTTPDGATLLIDYKTGQVKPNLWFTERIQDPQLPLYACKLDPQGIAFAGIAKGKIQWHSVTDEKSSLKPIGKVPRNIPKETNWQDLMDFWKTRLSALATEFIEGRLIIEPIKQDATCRNCGLHPLCRIGEPDDESGEDMA